MRYKFFNSGDPSISVIFDNVESNPTFEVECGEKRQLFCFSREWYLDNLPSNQKEFYNRWKEEMAGKEFDSVLFNGIDFTFRGPCLPTYKMLVKWDLITEVDSDGGTTQTYKEKVCEQIIFEDL